MVDDNFKDELQLESIVRQTFEDFSKDLELKRLFGVQALQDKFQREFALKTGANEHVSEEMVLNFINESVNEVNNNFDAAYGKSLARVQQALSQYAQPRFELDNPNAQPDLAANAQNKQRLSPKWTDRMDLSADPKIRQAVQDITNIMNNDPDKKGLVTQFELISQRAEQTAKNQYRNRLKLQMTPPRSAPKARPDA